MNNITYPTVLNLTTRQPATTWVYDTEVFPGYVLHVFTDGTSWKTFTHETWPALRAFIWNPTLALVGFNNEEYDDVILRYLIAYPDATPTQIYALSKHLVEEKPQWKKRINEIRRIPITWGLSVDMRQIMSTQLGLKECACAAGCLTIAETPVDFDQEPTIDQCVEIEQYCHNDVAVTASLFLKHQDLLRVRHQLAHEGQLGNDVYHLANAQLGERVMAAQYAVQTGTTPSLLKRLVQSSPTITQLAVSGLLANNVAFTTPEFQLVANQMRAATIRSGKGDKMLLDLPGFPDGEVTLAGQQLKIGLGGIHNSRKNLVVHADTEHQIWDVDVTSFYPSIIVNLGITPGHMNQGFPQILAHLRDQRVERKRNKETVAADALKIVINSVFGKLNSQYSPFYDPRCTYQVVLNGQLYLLMLLEQVSLAGAEAINVNTDGIILRVPITCAAAATSALRNWEYQTGFNLEQKLYRAIWQLDVSNYLAIEEQTGWVKRKGSFGYGPGRSGKTEVEAIPKAVEAFLVRGESVADTIAANDSAVDFLYYQHCRKSDRLTMGDQILPRTIRWYAATSGAPIMRCGKTKATVPNTQQARLALTLTTMRATDLIDLDRNWYVERAQEIINRFNTPPTPAIPIAA